MHMYVGNLKSISQGEERSRQDHRALGRQKVHSEGCPSGGQRGRRIKIAQLRWGMGEEECSPGEGASVWVFPAPGLCSKCVHAFTRLG